jgi:AGCS family alanine or glycine:cation symporter
VLTQQALTVHIGAAGNGFIAIAIMFFAFTSIIGNYAYAESAMTFLNLGGKIWITVLRILVLLMVVWGAYQSVATVFNTADAAMGLMATVNLIAITALSGLVVKLTRDYFEQQRVGKPRFDPAQYPELAGKIDTEIWRERRSSDG